MAFEFQRFVTIGQYLPRPSPIHHLDPRIRLIAGSLLLAALTATTKVPGLLFGLVILFGLLHVARVPLTYAIRGLLPSLPFILLLALIQVFFSPQSTGVVSWWRAGPLTVSAGGLRSALILLMRFPALILALTLITATTSTSELVTGLEALLRPLEKLGFPTQDFVLMIRVAVRFLPLLTREMERIAKAQPSRGADWGRKNGGLIHRTRQILPLIIPLFLVTLERAENLALAMEARGYHSHRPRSSMHVLRIRPVDILSLCLTVMLSAGIALL